MIDTLRMRISSALIRLAYAIEPRESGMTDLHLRVRDATIVMHGGGGGSGEPGGPIHIGGGSGGSGGGAYHAHTAIGGPGGPRPLESQVVAQGGGGIGGIGPYYQLPTVLSSPEDAHPDASPPPKETTPNVGFTQEDIRRLRAAPEIYSGYSANEEDAWLTFLDSLVARIAALLPPESC